MNTYNEMRPYIENGDYDYHFWNAIRGKTESYERMKHGRDISTGAYAMAPISEDKCLKALEKESLFRRIGTVMNAYKTAYRIFAKDSNDLAQWVADGESIPIYNGIDDFTTFPVLSHKLAVFIKSDESFIHDATFDFEDYLTKRFAKNFGKAEEHAFINGTGINMPTGILCPDKGAEIAFTTDTISYDDVVRLFFSTEVDYRRKGLWLMNDKTALHIRTLKDDAGNYLWNQNNDTILGKQVITSEYMPDMVPGSMSIAFGDFTYYWVICRRPISVRTIKEKFVAVDQIGHLAFEFLDGKLIRPKAVKTIQMRNADPVDTQTE